MTARRVIATNCAASFVFLAAALAHDHQKLEPADGEKIHGIGNNVFHTAAYVQSLAAANAPFRPLVDKRYLGKPLPGPLTTTQFNNLLAWMNDVRAAGRIPEMRFGLHDPGAPMGQRGFDTEVALGLHDAYIDSVADVMVAYGGPIYVRIGSEFNEIESHEMRPYDFPAAFRRVVLRAHARGVDQAAWVWNILISGVVFDNWDAVDASGEWLWYPGDEFVDWFGIDNFHPSAYYDPPVNSYGLHTKKFMAFAETHRKPVMLAETSMFKVYVTADPLDGMNDWQVFAPSYFSFINKTHRTKAFFYISADWATIPPWQSWGNATLQDNPYIFAQWIAELSKPQYLSDLIDDPQPFPHPWINLGVQSVPDGGIAAIGAHNCPAGGVAFALISPSRADKGTKIYGVEGQLRLSGSLLVIGPIPAGADQRAVLAGAIPPGAGPGTIYAQVVVMDPNGGATPTITDVGKLILE